MIKPNWKQEAVTTQLLLWPAYSVETSPNCMTDRREYTLSCVHYITTCIHSVYMRCQIADEASAESAGEWWGREEMWRFFPPACHNPFALVNAVASVSAAQGEIYHINHRPLHLMPSWKKKKKMPAVQLFPPLNQHGCWLVLAKRRCPFLSNLAPVQLSTLTASLPVRASGFFGRRDRARGREEERQYKHCSAGFLQARRVGKLISRYWFLTAARLLLCPRACWSALLHLFPVHLPITPANLPLNSSLSLSALPFVSTRLAQQLIHHRAVFFFSSWVLPFTFLCPFLF